MKKLVPLIPLMLACPPGDPGFNPPDREAVRIIISQGCANNQVAVASTCEMTAQVLDRNNSPLEKALTWTSSEITVAIVNPKPGFGDTIGEVTGVGAGNAVIRVAVRLQPDVFTERAISVVGDNDPNN